MDLTPINDFIDQVFVPCLTFIIALCLLDIVYDIWERS